MTNEPTPDHDDLRARTRRLLTQLRRPRVLRVLLTLLVLASIATALTLRGSEAEPLRIRLSDLPAVLESDTVERFAIDERAGVLFLYLAEDDHGASLEAATRFAQDNDRPAPSAPPEGEGEVSVLMAFPPSHAPLLTEQLLGEGVPFGAVIDEPTGIWLDLLRVFGPMLLLVGALIYVMRTQGGIGRMSSGRDREVEIPEVRFADVAGVDEAVGDLSELVAYLTDAERFTAAGARAPKGVLLEGPPGTGKTLLARAVAGEAGVPFFALSGSDFVETFVGVGAKRVRELFKKARKHGKAVIFIDEIDAVGRARSQNGGYGHDERENTLNALLVEMDGFDRTEIIVLAATNRGDMLDPALLRPGRFDRRVAVGLPDRAGRTAILEVHARGKQFSEQVDLVALARRTPQMSGAELENLINTAALEAARESAELITSEHLESALQTLALGRARTSAIVPERDRLITAWHEAGHTLAALLQEHADDPVTVTIIPRGPSGGATWMAGSDRTFLTRNEALARLVTALAGRAAEELLLDGDYTQGAAGDLESATQTAMSMVTRYGMSGTLAVIDGERYRAGGSSGSVDAAVEELLQDALASARELLTDNRGKLETLVAWLLEDETVGSERLEQLRA
jgi:cell division protease FtsH